MAQNKNPGDEERPWTEDQWEKFMKQSDLRSARFGELFETLANDPNRDEKIGHEMGWDKPPKGDPEEISEMNELMAEAERAVDAGEVEYDPEAEDREVAAIPAYKAAMKLSERVQKAVDALFKKASEDDNREDEDLAREVDDAAIGPQIACAKIAGGHGMGYDDDVLCANIVKNRQALAGIEQGRGGLEALKKRGSIPITVADPLIAECDQVHSLILQRIAELRAKVWW